MRSIYDDVPRAVLLRTLMDETTMRDIHKATRFEISAIHFSVNMLESLGLVESEKIGRVRLLKTTPKGQRIAELFREIERAMG